MQFDRTLDTIMETNTSNQTIAGILSQYYIINRAKQLHLLAYHAKTLSAAQWNRPIHDKELFAIVDSFRKCSDWLVAVEVNVYKDYHGLQYFHSKLKLNFRQASWYLHMSEFRYNIHYWPGTTMDKPDGLSRRSRQEKSRMDANCFQEGQLLT